MGTGKFQISVDLFDFDEEVPREESDNSLLAHIGIDTESAHILLDLCSLDDCRRALEELLDAATWIEDFLQEKESGNRGRT